MQKLLQTYLRRLTNLSSNNRSLLFLRLISDQSIDLHDFNYTFKESSFSIIQNLIAQKGKIPLVQEVDRHDHLANKIALKLKKIARIESFIFNERGAKDLYVGWPFVRGKFNDGTLVRGPLIFFPVSLIKDGNTWFLEQKSEVNVSFNKTLLLAYAHYNQTNLAEDLLEHSLLDLEQDDVRYRTKVYELLKHGKIELDFNQENFTNKLQSFENFKKTELEEQTKNGKIKLYPEAVLGIFPQSGSYLVPDYTKLIEQHPHESLEDFFAEKIKKLNTQRVKISDHVKEENTFTPFAMDASQEAAIKKIKSGQSLVIQGPPGTGKSQLIANVICDYIARGKNILLISQKRAALDVVFERLKSKELHDFVGLVHDFKNDRKHIFEQIAKQIDHIDNYEHLNNNLDSIQLERKFVKSSRTIDQVSEELDDFKKAFFDENECGKSVKELYLTSNPNGQQISLNQEYRDFHYDQIDDFERILQRYLDYQERLENQSDFWSDRPDYGDFNTSDLNRLRDIVDQTIEFQQKLIHESADFLRSPVDFETSLHFLSHRDEITQLSTILDNDLVYKYFLSMEEVTNVPDEWLSEIEERILRCFKNSGMEQTLQTQELGKFQEALEEAIQSRRNVVNWVKWKTTSKNKIFVTRVLVANKLKSDDEGFQILLERIDNRLNYEHVKSIIEQTEWLKEYPESFRVIDIQNWFYYQKLAFKSSVLLQNIRTLNNFAPSKEHTREEYIGILKRFSEFIDQVPTQTQLWSRYLSEKQIRALMLGKAASDKIKQELNLQFDSLVDFDKLKNNLSQNQQKVIDELISNVSSSNEIIPAFRNSLALAWINHIESKYPILRSVSSLKMDHLTQTLREAITDKNECAEAILLLKARERTYKDLEYNRLNNLVTYRDLYHQVTKKKKLWPLRQVIAKFKEELFSILPCWMASPESASAIFPMEELFDLIIFDEASQCFSEKGIPGMYRGKQVIVAGDQHQLQPTDLYRVKWEEEDEESPELEIDSLLQLSAQHLENCMLTGHYRSKSLDLISFSNQHFYNNKLELIPDLKIQQTNEPAIEFIKCNGKWENNCNLQEAEETVALTKKLILQDPKKAIGIVTFNTHQQGLILDLMEKENMYIPSNLFVKNIENVQGDERDIIIFSVAYAKDKEGKLNLRFGSLNLAGGENRLNVAITRAKEKNYIITSIDPSELNVENTQNKGPKLLKAYLDYALEVSNNKWKPSITSRSKHHSDWYLKDQLQKDHPSLGLYKELPFTDLIVKSKDKPSGLVLTDDDFLFHSQSAKDFYAYRHENFTLKHWPYIQFYSRDYWLNREGITEKLEKFKHRTS